MYYDLCVCVCVCVAPALSAARHTVHAAPSSRAQDRLYHLKRHVAQKKKKKKERKKCKQTNIKLMQLSSSIKADEMLFAPRSPQRPCGVARNTLAPLQTTPKRTWKQPQYTALVKIIEFQSVSKCNVTGRTRRHSPSA